MRMMFFGAVEGHLRCAGGRLWSAVKWFGEKLWAVIAGTLIRKRVGARSEGRKVTTHFATRRSSENMLVIIVFFSWAVHGSSAVRRFDHMANPYSSSSCAPFYCLLVGELWLRGLGVFWGGSHSTSWCGLGRGGSTSGPLITAGGAVGSQDLSPEAAVWVTSGTTTGRRTPEQGKWGMLV